jgi:hypothetical protein
MVMALGFGQRVIENVRQLVRIRQVPHTQRGLHDPVGQDAGAIAALSMRAAVSHLPHHDGVIEAKLDYGGN